MAMNEDTTGTVRSLLGNNSILRKISKVREVYDALNLPERIHELISAYIDTAIKNLDNIELSPEARVFLWTWLLNQLHAISK